MEIDELTRIVTRLQQQIDGLIKPEAGRWITWTPTITQLVNVTFNTTYARYTVYGRTVTIGAYLAITGAGTTANSIDIGGIPTIAQPVNFAGLATVGIFNIQDATGTIIYVGSLVAANATTFKGIVSGVNAYIGVNPNFGLANGDVLAFQATYEC